MKLCKCGKRIPQGESCSCQKKRHHFYDKTCRDKTKQKFYSSISWKKIVQMVKARANGLDEYQMAVNGIILIGAVVHHIYTIDDRPDLKRSLDNLIFVSARTHNMIHAEYDKNEKTKSEMQKKLWKIHNATGDG